MNTKWEINYKIEISKNNNNKIWEISIKIKIKWICKINILIINNNRCNSNNKKFIIITSMRNIIRRIWGHKSKNINNRMKMYKTIRIKIIKMKNSFNNKMTMKKKKKMINNWKIKAKIMMIFLI